MSYLDEPKRHGRAGREKLTWYRPTFGEIVRQMEWWWGALPVAAMAAGGMVVAGLLLGPDHIEMAWVGGRMLLVLVVVPFIFWEHVRDRVIKARADPFCIHCGWTLTGLPEEGRCPECGEPYRMKIVDMFRRDPQWVIAYWRFNSRPPSVELFNSRHPGRKARG